MKKDKIHKKAKLPRKRKKAMIAVEGRSSYNEIVALNKVDPEPLCKFWIKSKVTDNITQTVVNGEVKIYACPIPTPNGYW